MTLLPGGWKAATYISLVVIVGLVALNIIGGPKGLRAGDIQSMVILPFDNFTGDDQAFTFMEKLDEQGNLDVAYMASNFAGYEHFKSYPGIVEILKKYKLPYPKD